MVHGEIKQIPANPVRLALFEVEGDCATINGEGWRIWPRNCRTILPPAESPAKQIFDEGTPRDMTC
jgi:hypothetical protein